MRLTKFEHACFTVEKDGQVLVVDPGAYTSDFVVPDNVVGVVITHVHPDHWDKEKLQAIVATNPDVVILGAEQVVDQLDGFNTQTVTANEGVKIGAFELEFFGGQHALIVDGWPIDQNVGVLINQQVYYPGDSFALPEGRDVPVLALPVSAPWLKYNETAEFFSSIKPTMAFPTHDAILSDLGKATVDRWSASIAEKIGTKYQRLDGPIDI